MRSGVSFGWVSLALGFVVSLSAYSSLAATNETNREIARTYTSFHFEQKDFRSAVEVLHRHLTEDSCDDVAWNLIGLAYLELGQNANALKSFHAAASLTAGETRGVYLYNHADAANRLGESQKAEQALAAVAAEPRLKKGAEYAIQNRREKTPLPALFIEEAGQWRLMGALSTGYDTNVLLISDTNSATALATGKSSPYLSPLLQAVYAKDSRDSRLSVSGLAGFTAYTVPQAKTYNALSTGAGAEWAQLPASDTRWQHRVGNQFGLNYLNTDGLKFYNWSNVARWSLSFSHSSIHESEFSIPLGYEKYALESDDDPADDRTGVVAGAELTYRRYLGKNRFSAGAQFSRQFARGSNYRSNTYALPLSWTRSGLPWSLVGNFTIEPS